MSAWFVFWIGQINKFEIWTSQASNMVLTIVIGSSTKENMISFLI